MQFQFGAALVQPWRMRPCQQKLSLLHRFSAVTLLWYQRIQQQSWFLEFKQFRVIFIVSRCLNTTIESKLSASTKTASLQPCIRYSCKFVANSRHFPHVLRDSGVHCTHSLKWGTFSLRPTCFSPTRSANPRSTTKTQQKCVSVTAEYQHIRTLVVTTVMVQLLTCILTLSTH